MNKKYFFFDIDGTLTNKQTGAIIPSALVALEKLQQNGHFVAIATGRAHYKALPFMKEVGLQNMVCSGGTGLVFNNQLLENKPLDLEKAKAVAKQAEELGYGTLFMLEDSSKVWAKNDWFRKQVGPRQEKTEYIIDPLLDIDQLQTIYKLYVAIPENEETRLTCKDSLGYMRFVPEYLMFQYDQKNQGIMHLLTYAKGDPEQVVVFGDDTNDLVMFQSQWTNIAMGNAPDDLKEKADYVTDSNVDDGIFNACVHFAWIEPNE